MTNILFDAQQALFDALSANADVQALLGENPRLYDYVPQGAVYPYVVYGPARVTPYDAKNDASFEQIVTFNVWSQYRGGKETRALFQALYNVLHRAEIALDGNPFLYAEFHSADFALDSDGLTYHAAVRFTVITQNA